MSFTPEGTLTRTTYGPGSEGWPTTPARRAVGGKDGNGSQSMSSGRTDLNAAWSGWWVVAIVPTASDSVACGSGHRVDPSVTLATPSLPRPDPFCRRLALRPD